MPVAPESLRVGASAGETSSLLGDDVTKPEAGDDSSAMRNFIGLCFAFGVSHSCVTVGIAYASSVFDLTLGSVSTGLVYTLYTLTSLLAAAPFVDYVGPRNGMTLAMLGFLLYLICFVVGQAVDKSNFSLEYTVVIIGSICGGLSSSVGLVSQGVYYARSAAQHSRNTGISLGAANELLAGRFTTICESLAPRA
jgi:MFS family permease